MAQDGRCELRKSDAHVEGATPSIRHRQTSVCCNRREIIGQAEPPDNAIRLHWVNTLLKQLPGYPPEGGTGTLAPRSSLAWWDRGQGEPCAPKGDRNQGMAGGDQITHSKRGIGTLRLPY